MQRDIYKIYVQDSHAAATRLEMQKAYSHNNISSVKSKTEKPMSPRNAEHSKVI